MRTRTEEAGQLNDDLDIKAFIDTVPFGLILRAVARHTDQKWILLYVERWLKAPVKKADGTLAERTRGLEAHPGSQRRARTWLKGVRKRAPGLFAHWQLRYTTW